MQPDWEPPWPNFLEVLGADMKPTGRIVLRDFGDTYLNPTIVEASIRPSLIRLWSPSPIKPLDLSVLFGPLHGNQAPTWLSASGKEKWARTLMNRWEAKFSELTGVTIETLVQPGEVPPRSRRFGLLRADSPKTGQEPLGLEAALEVFHESRTDTATRKWAAETVKSVLGKALANPVESSDGASIARY